MASPLLMGRCGSRSDRRGLGRDLGIAGGTTVLLYARSRLVMAIRAAGLPGPTDGPSTDLDDFVGLGGDLRHSVGLGFTGKMCLRPRQLCMTNYTFAPPPSKLAWARRVLAATRASPTSVVRVDGEMLDWQHIEDARHIWPEPLSSILQRAASENRSCTSPEPVPQRTACSRGRSRTTSEVRRWRLVGRHEGQGRHYIRETTSPNMVTLFAGGRPSCPDAGKRAAVHPIGQRGAADHPMEPVPSPGLLFGTIPASAARRRPARPDHPERIVVSVRSRKHAALAESHAETRHSGASRKCPDAVPRRQVCWRELRSTSSRETSGGERDNTGRPASIRDRHC
jgi:hypothetical protein